MIVGVFILSVWLVGFLMGLILGFIGGHVEDDDQETGAA